MDLLRWAGRLQPTDSKTFQRRPFAVPEGARALQVALVYERGGDLPHNLVTLSLFDPGGFRGAGHRFAPRQAARVEEAAATPGFVPGPLPAGRWVAELDLHCVIAPSAFELTVEAVEPSPPRPAALVPEAVRPAGRPAGGPRWLRGELHLHSTHSDGRWTTAEMAGAARGRGLDFMFLTDHNTVTGVEGLRDALRGEVEVHAGQELTTFGGHALALGPDRWIDWRAGLGGRGINDVARDVRAADGVLVIAHPDAPPDPFCTGCRWTHDGFDPSLAHAVEVWGGLWDGPEERNEGCLALFRRWLDAGHRLTATGATDAHRQEDWEGAVPLTYVLAPDASLPSVLGALRAGTTYVSSGPALALEAQTETGVTPIGGSVAGPVSLLARASGTPLAELRLVSRAGTLARARVDGEGSLRAAPRGGERWCCAELWRDEVLLAVTSPVYLET